MIENCKITRNWSSNIYFLKSLRFFSKSQGIGAEKSETIQMHVFMLLLNLLFSLMPCDPWQGKVCCSFNGECATWQIFGLLSLYL